MNQSHPPTLEKAPEKSQASEHGKPDEASLPRIGMLAVLGFVLVFLLILTALFLAGWLPRLTREKVLKEDQAEVRAAVPIVEVGKPTREKTAADLVLPGDTSALQETAIFPRANGYLKSQTVDIGDHVEEGKLLALIDSPEVDADYNQAVAALAQARAAAAQAKASVTKAESDRKLAQDTYERYAGYAQTGGVNKQVVDERKAAVDQAAAAYDVAVAAGAAADASVGAAEAMVKRSADLQGFEKITAPFTGTITARNYDKGALLSASNTTPGHEMYRITQDDPLRVFVSVPQAYIGMVRPGLPADLTVRNYPGRTFPGQVVRSTDEVDPATRTLRYEVHVDNKDHALVAGMYGQIRFHLRQERPLLTVPSSALLFEANGLSVAVVRDGKTHFQPIAVGRDLGTRVEVSEGLSDDADVVLNPGERLAEGVAVEVAAKASAAPAEAPAGTPPTPRAVTPAEEAKR